MCSQTSLDGWYKVKRIFLYNIKTTDTISLFPAANLHLFIGNKFGSAWTYAYMKIVLQNEMSLQNDLSDVRVPFDVQTQKQR